ncbi:hypothetical protein AWC14_13175 [Mycobacterium kyorinense]|uniref:Uncharacterized protein n=1 Tax=Mycobacterium kyorinense TaxID=487514 RepID=A0A1X1XI29_9MYCO|nr:hypothetical protein AWC14_13175 [Mycobacterium kyorinense]
MTRTQSNQAQRKASRTIDTILTVVLLLVLAAIVGLRCAAVVDRDSLVHGEQSGADHLNFTSHHRPATTSTAATSTATHGHSDYRATPTSWVTTYQTLTKVLGDTARESEKRLS